MTSIDPGHDGQAGRPQHPPVVPVVYLPARQANSLAIAALVLGICAWIPCAGTIPGLLAVIFGIIVLVKGWPGRRMAIAGIIVSASAEVLTVLAAVFVFAVAGYDRTMAKQNLCGMNLGRISAGVAMYQAANANTPPPNLSVLASGGMIMPGDLKCPICQKATASGSDYFYAPPAPNAPPGALVACDFRGNHADGSRNILCVDETVRTVQTPVQFKAELAKPENAAFAAALAAIEGR